MRTDFTSKHQHSKRNCDKSILRKQQWDNAIASNENLTFCVNFDLQSYMFLSFLIRFKSQLKLSFDTRLKIQESRVRKTSNEENQTSFWTVKQRQEYERSSEIKGPVRLGQDKNDFQGSSVDPKSFRPQMTVLTPLHFDFAMNQQNIFHHFFSTSSIFQYLVRFVFLSSSLTPRIRTFSHSRTVQIVLPW